MFEAALARWGFIVELFFTAPATLLGGGVGAFSVVGTLGVVLLVLGLVVIALQRVRQAVRLALPLLIAAVSPFLFALGSLVGTVAVAIFVFVAVALTLIIWLASIARDAAGRRAGIWLFGWGLMAFTLLGIMFEVMAPVSLRG